MKTKKVILSGIVAISFAVFITTGCKKDADPAPSPVPQVIPNGSSSQQTQKASDQNTFENECNRAMDDATNAMQDCSTTRSVQTVCNMTVDTSLAAQGKITLNYTGNDCLNLTSRTGSIVIQLPYNGTTLTTWTTMGAKAILTFNNYKVTRLSDNKSLTFNGFHSIKNVTGGGVIQLLMGTTIIHQIRANMQITFDDGTNRTWLVAKTRTFSNTLGVIKATIAGDTTFGTYTQAAVWGTNRLGQPFTIDMPTSFSYNIIGSLCIYRPLTGVVVDYTPSFTFTITYGVDMSGNAVVPGVCPFGYKISWIDINNAPQQVILPY